MNAIEYLARSDDNANDVDDASLKLIQALTFRDEAFATAEPLTTGFPCATVTSTPGASTVLQGDIVTYATNTRALLADALQDVLAVYGPVSDLTVRHMVLGVANRTMAD